MAAKSAGAKVNKKVYLRGEVFGWLMAQYGHAKTQKACREAGIF